MRYCELVETSAPCFLLHDSAASDNYALSLHDALPISSATFSVGAVGQGALAYQWARNGTALPGQTDRKSTRLNSSHSQISYAVFCLKKKNNTHILILSVPAWIKGPRLPACA